MRLSQNTDNNLGMVAHAFNPKIWEAEAGEAEFKDSLVYEGSSRLTKKKNSQVGLGPPQFRAHLPGGTPVTSSMKGQPPSTEDALGYCHPWSPGLGQAGLCLPPPPLTVETVLIKSVLTSKSRFPNPCPGQQEGSWGSTMRGVTITRTARSGGICLAQPSLRAQGMWSVPRKPLG